jgi:cysteinyl-tRNA synthetase
MTAINMLDSLPTSNTSSVDVETWKNSCYTAMNDDFNSPVLIAKLFDAVKLINTVNDNKDTITKEDLSILKETLNAFVFDVLGLENTNSNTATDSSSDKLSGTLELLIQLRAEARANKDFATSDKIRDELAKLDIELKDGKDGTVFNL